MTIVTLKEFKPTILFLAKFLGIYLIGNLIYGLYITAYEPSPDPVTRWVTTQVSTVLSVSGWDTDVQSSIRKPTSNLVYEDKAILAVYEGCNGINIVIIFIAFIFAFSPITKCILWFVPMGLFIIHLSNLVRIILLFFVVTHRPEWMYYTHKYFFTAILYIIIFFLWIGWVEKFSFRKNE